MSELPTPLATPSSYLPVGTRQFLGPLRGVILSTFTTFCFVRSTGATTEQPQSYTRYDFMVVSADMS